MKPTAQVKVDLTTFKSYWKEVQTILNREDVREESFYSTLEELITGFGNSIGYKVYVTTVPKKSEAGNPDFRVWNGESIITGYIEAKNPKRQIDLDKVEASEQITRYLEAYENLIVTNFIEFRLYRNKTRVATVNLETDSYDKLAEFLEIFFDYSRPAITTVEELSSVLAKKTQIMRDYVILPGLENKSEYFAKLFQSFRNGLVHDLTPKTFADVFAQTFAYGLFIAKYQKDKTNDNSIEFNTHNAYKFIQRNFGVIRNLFATLTFQDMPRELEIVVDDIISVLNTVNIPELMRKHYMSDSNNSVDPVYYLYEHFLASYDPERRKQLGVYYTPPEVVTFMVNAVNDILKNPELFDAPDGLATYDPKSKEKTVHLLDPATGTGTFFISAIDKAIQEVKKYSNSQEIVNQFVHEHILKNFYAFEISVTPYVVSHLKTMFLLSEKHNCQISEQDNFNIVLTNTLDTNANHDPKVLGLFEELLAKEQRKAYKIKTETPIMVVIGNPPYSISSLNKIDENSDFGQFYAKYKENVRKKYKNISALSDDYVKFIAFAHWRIRKTGKGIIAFITNNSYVDGLVHIDMRKALLDDFDKVYILNLHGDVRKQDKHEVDQNVFNIRQGVCIAIFVKPEKTTDKELFYYEIKGDRDSKIQFLSTNNINTINWIKFFPQEPEFYFTSAKAKNKEYEIYSRFANLRDIFAYSRMGIQTGNDRLFIGYTYDELLYKIKELIEHACNEKWLKEQYDLRDDLIKKINKNKVDITFSSIKPIMYRPLDIRLIYYEPKMLLKPGNEYVQYNFDGNLHLGISEKLISNTIVSKNMIDVVCASTLTYMFPLYSSPNTSNIQSGILEGLSNIFQSKVTPYDVFSYIYAIFYANRYRSTYAPYFKSDDMRIPFTKAYPVFRKLADLGHQLITLHTMEANITNSLQVTFEGEGDNVITKVTYDKNTKRVYVNKTQYFSNIDEYIYEYVLAGSQVLYKWLRSRKGRKLTFDDIRYYVKVANIIAKTIEIQKEIDAIYPEVETNLLTL